MTDKNSVTLWVI